MNYKSKFNIVEFIVHSEKSSEWESIINLIGNYFPYEISEKTENYLRVHVLIYGSEDVKIIQTLAKQIYGKIMPFGHVRTVIIEY